MFPSHLHLYPCFCNEHLSLNTTGHFILTFSNIKIISWCCPRQTDLITIRCGLKVCDLTWWIQVRQGKFWNIWNHKCTSRCCSGKTLQGCLSILINFGSWWITFNFSCVKNLLYLISKSILVFLELSELNSSFYIFLLLPFFHTYTQSHFTKFGNQVISIQLMAEFFL